MVNIIIPVFHSRETLPRALKSLENQTDRKFIVTIVVDGDGEKYEDITAATPLNTYLFILMKIMGRVLRVSMHLIIHPKCLNG